MPTDAELLTLHRYYIWANKFRTHFDQTLDAPVDPADPPLLWFAGAKGLFLSYWYAALSVVIEGWKSLGCADAEIDVLLDSANVKHLQRYRNGVCHFQPKYLDRRFLELMTAPDSVEWVRRLNTEFGRYFLTRPHVSSSDSRIESRNRRTEQ